METGYLNFHDEEHFSDFSLSLGQHDLLDDSQSSLLPIEDDFDYVEARLDTSGGLWGTEQELNGDMAVLPVSGVASVIPKIDNMKEDFAKVLTDWQEHIGYLQASDMGEDIDMAELSMGITEKINTDLPEDIFQNEMAETRIIAHSSPMKKRQRDFTNTRSPKFKTISESSSQEIDVIGLDSSEDIEPVLDLMHVECDHASSLSDDIDYELLAASRGTGNFDLASYITGDDDDDDASALPSSTTSEKISSLESLVDCKNPSFNIGKKIDPAIQVTAEEKLHEANDEVDDSVDVETVVEQMPVLEAGDVKSLLEQFEASEASGIVRPIERKTNVTNDDNDDNEKNIESTMARSIDQSKQSAILNKPSETQDSKFHKNIRDSLPKEVIERIKASARKKVISVIPALSSPKIGARSTRMQEAAASLSRTKLLKIVTNSTNSSNGRVDGSVQLDHDYCSISGNNRNTSTIRVNCENTETTMNPKVGMAEIASSLPLKHSLENDIVNRVVEPAGYYMPITKKKCDKTRKNTTKKEPDNGGKTTKKDRAWGDSSSRKDSGLESGEVSDASEETLTPVNSFSIDDKNDDKKKHLEIRDKNCASTRLVDPTNLRLTTNDEKTRAKGASSEINGAPIYEMKIRSALATSILQLRKGVLTKTKSLEAGGKVKQMISVLKKPPNGNVVAKRPNESIVTTKNSSNDDIRNIIVRQENDECSSSVGNEASIRETSDAIDDARKTTAPPRRKLNLAEYRSRREQTRSDNSRTCSPIQPMTLVYIHHASTTTEPNRDDPENPVWSEREIVSVLKPKTDFEDEKNRERPPTREIAVQTGETTSDDDDRDKLDENVSAVATLTPDDNIVNDESAGSETRLARMKERKNRRYRRRRTSSSSTSRSRSRSPMNRDRSTSRSRNKSRSRSRRCSSSSNPRRRRISRRRSSVSSSSSWSSRSRSYTRSISRSRSRSLRSRSRSSRSRSRSRSSSRYSSCSRSSSRSNLGRSKWSGDARSKRRRGRREPRTNCDRYRRGSSASSHSYRGCRRSSQSAYRRQYDAWYHKEKKRQMEERRVIYVGRLDENTAKADLRRRFEAFGPVLDISVHFREHGDNYGFVTFAYKNDAYEAVEHGNDDPSLPRYDLSFGGRRAFCKVKYADLDGIAGNSLNNSITPARNLMKSDEENTFDLLLKEAKAKLRKRKV